MDLFINLTQLIHMLDVFILIFIKNATFLYVKNVTFIKNACNDELTNKIVKTAKQNNFTVSNTTLEIVGHCHDCTE